MSNPTNDERAAAVFQLSSIINAAIARITDDPLVIIPAITRNLAINVVTETPHLSWEETRAEAVRQYRDALNEARAMYVKAQEANDNG